MIQKQFYNFDLDNKIILVTGATGHLGRSISFGIAKAGGIPIICGRSEKKLENLTSSLQEHGLKSMTVCCDLSELKAVKKISEFIKQNCSVLDGIVNCAYSGKASSIEGASVDDFKLANVLNIEVPFFLLQENLSLLRAAAGNHESGASIVNIASMYGMISPNPEIYQNREEQNPPFYGPSKSALIQLTKYLACHLGPENIRVNCISPGPFPSDEVCKKQPDFIKKLSERSPLKRCGKAEELIGAIIFLLSSASSYINGVNIPVDGGWTAW